MRAITPCAQVFTVDSAISPNGIFVAAVDFCFAAIDDSQGISVQLRPTINGFPDVDTVYHNGETILSPGSIPIVEGAGSDLPTFTDSSKYARFTFPGLVYLPPGDHAVVFQTPSSKYRVFLAELQQPILGSTRKVSAQPYVGSSFRSQNGGVWTPYQNQALMFRIIRAQFPVNTPGVVQFDNLKPSANLNMDVFNVNMNDISFGKTKISYAFKSTDVDGNVDTTAQNLQVKRDYIPSVRRRLRATSNGDFKVFTTISTSDDQVSPILDASRLNVIGIENIINNGELSNSLIQITNQGTGWSNGNVTVTIDAPTGTGGVQAVAYANCVAGKIVSITFSNPGSGYIVTPNISLTGANTGQATATITGETGKSGGNAYVRYITRPVTLADGFDSTQLKVYLNGVKQPGTDIQVYYKILSSQDPDQSLNNKNWTRMVLDNNNNVYSRAAGDFIEYSYVTSQGAQIPAQPVTYTDANGVTYSNFKNFILKICLFSNSTAVVPVVKSLRGIALA